MKKIFLFSVAIATTLFLTFGLSSCLKKKANDIASGFFPTSVSNTKWTQNNVTVPGSTAVFSVTVTFSDGTNYKITRKDQSNIEQPINSGTYTYNNLNGSGSFDEVLKFDVIGDRLSIETNKEIPSGIYTKE